MQVDYLLLGKRLAELRKKRGLTQERLAQSIDVTSIYISHIETCRSIPSLETVVKLCDALEVTPNELLLGIGVCSSNYLSDDILQKLEQCTPAERRLISGFLDLLQAERENASKKRG